MGTSVTSGDLPGLQALLNGLARMPDRRRTQEGLRGAEGSRRARGGGSHGGQRGVGAVGDHDAGAGSMMKALAPGSSESWELWRAGQKPGRLVRALHQGRCTR